MKEQGQDNIVRIELSGSPTAVAEALARMVGHEPEEVEAPVDSLDGDDVIEDRVYNYVDEQGAVLYRVRRREFLTGGKSFITEVPGPGGRFVPGRVVRVVPYNLQRLRQVAEHGGTIAICNGERAAAAYEAAHGGADVAATTFWGGICMCRARYAGFFRGASKVVFVVDGSKLGEVTLRRIRALEVTLESRGIETERTTEVRAALACGDLS